MSPRRVLAVVAAGVLALALAACDPAGEEPTSAPSPSATTATPGPTTSAPPTEEPTSAAPEVPPPNPADFPGMDQQTEEGAKQAFRFYWASIVHGYQTGETVPLEELSTGNCIYCQSARSDIQSLSSTDALWGSATIVDLGIRTDRFSDTSADISYVFAVSEHAERDPASRTVSSAPEKTYGTAGRVVWTNGKWLVEGLALDK